MNASSTRRIVGLSIMTVLAFVAASASAGRHETVLVGVWVAVIVFNLVVIGVILRSHGEGGKKS
jgi:hypothetical protein